MDEKPKVIDVATATEEDVVRYAIAWIKPMIEDEQKASEEYGAFADLIEEAERRPLGRERFKADLKHISNVVGGISLDELKHHEQLTRLLHELEDLQKILGA